MEYKISEIQIVPVKPNNGLIGFASLVFENSFYLGSIGIYTKLQGGYRLAYPTRGLFNVFYPINHFVADQVEKAVISRFEEVMKHAGHDSSSA